jgi:polysaccharide biosynthesis transport protein
MIAARQELQSIDAQLRREALKVVDSLAGQSKIAAARAESLRASLEKMKGRQSDANQSDVKLKELERNALANRTLLETMLSRFADASARQDLSLQPGFARIIQKASASAVPYFPKPGPIMFLTTLAGLGLGLGLAFLLEVMSAAARMNQITKDEPRAIAGPAYSPSEIRIPQMPAAWPSARTHAAEMPEEPVQVAERDQAVSAQMPSSLSLGSALAMIEATQADRMTELTEAASQIAGSCLNLREHQAIRTFALSSIGSKGADAAMATVATARSLAALKLKVIAIDVGSGATLETLFGIAQGPGLSDLVAGEADFTKVICRDPQSLAHAMRYGFIAGPNGQAAVMQKLASILTALESIYDIILVHAGEATPATSAFVKECKAAILLAPQIRLRDAAAAARTLEAKGALATILVRLASSAESLARTA